MSVIAGGTLGVTFPDGTTTPAADVNTQFSPYITDTANVMVIGANTNGAPVYFVGSTGVKTPVGTQTTSRPAVSYTYSASTANAALNITTLAGYVAGITDVTITVDTGIYIYSTSISTPALTLTGGSTGDTITLVNKGYIMGMGGKGGGSTAAAAGVLAQTGGTALSLGFNTTVNNTNASAYIGGGGGGGGAGNAMSGAVTQRGVAGGGGAGGGAGGDNVWFSGCCGTTEYKSGGAGGGIGASGANGGIYTLNGFNESVGGGGGGRVFPGTGGAGGYYTYAASGGTAGGGGASSNQVGGSGGSGSSAGGSQGGTYGAGGGGGWGASGGTGWTGGGGSGSTYAASGAGGKAVALNGKTVTWVSGNTTRVYGAVS
jgi:hypothetical protein